MAIDTGFSPLPGSKGKSFINLATGEIRSRRQELNARRGITVEQYAKKREEAGLGRQKDFIAKQWESKGGKTRGPSQSAKDYKRVRAELVIHNRTLTGTALKRAKIATLWDYGLITDEEYEHYLQELQ